MSQWSHRPSVAKVPKSDKFNELGPINDQDDQQDGMYCCGRGRLKGRKDGVNPQTDQRQVQRGELIHHGEIRGTLNSEFGQPKGN